jgi:hypothetical protein
LKNLPVFVLSIFAVVLILSACENPDSKVGHPDSDNSTSESQSYDDGAVQSHIPHYSKESLEQLLQRGDEMFNTAPNHDALERLAALQYASTHELMVIARALDTEDSFRNDISSYADRFAPENTSVDIAKRLTDSMLGMYSSIALLYSMRFQHNDEEMKALVKYRNDIEGMMQRNDPIIKPMTLMASGSYDLIKRILRDIDQEDRLELSFMKSDSLYRVGLSAATTGEDRYLNALYRLFEVSQIWALQLNLEKSADVDKIKKSFGEQLLAATTVGDQMAVAVEYQFRIFRMIAILTLDVMYSEQAQQ